MCTTEAILLEVSEIRIPGFFITVDFLQTSDKHPAGIENFLHTKHRAIIAEGITGRKFVYQSDGWRLAFTFFPTDRVVDEKYAMKNKMVKRST